MANHVKKMAARGLALDPEHRLVERTETGVTVGHVSGGWFHGVEKVSTGPVHWRESDRHSWKEIDTDFEDRGGGKSGVTSAGFDVETVPGGGLKVVPRRWLPDEWFGQGRWEWERNGQWTSVPMGTGGHRGAEHTTDGSDASRTVGVWGRGFRDEFTIKNVKDASRRVRQEITLNGLTWVEDDGGVRLVSGSDGMVVRRLQAPSWSDASGSPEPHLIKWVYEDGYLVLSPDLEGAVFPVVIA